MTLVTTVVKQQKKISQQIKSIQQAPKIPTSMDLLIQIQVPMLYRSIKIKRSNILEEKKADNIALGEIFFQFPTVTWVWPGQVIY